MLVSALQFDRSAVPMAQVVHFEREVSARGAGVVVYSHALHDHIGCQTRSIT